MKANYAGIIGSIMVISGSFSPMLHISIIGNWNYFKIEPALASVAIILAVLGMLGAVFGKPALQRFAGWFLLAWITFTFLATWFKVQDYFSIIPFKKLSQAMNGIIKFRYIGWTLLTTGSVFMLFVRRKSVTNNYNR